MAEVIKIDQITSFLAQVETTLGAIKSLLDFSPNHKSCFQQSNSFLDEMAQVAPMIMSQHVVLHHSEHDNTNRFIIGLLRIGSHLVCKYSYSLVQINLLLSSNILRDGDNSALVANYLTQMSTMFSQNNNKCIQHGLSVRMGKNFHTPYTEAFGLGTAGLETCARICKARNARFTHDTELSKLVFSNKTLIDCQGWTFTLFNSTCSWRKLGTITNLSQA